jgi:5'-deoxynucleotidase YfbR-like HD superfamily hydrolase
MKRGLITILEQNNTPPQSPGRKPGGGTHSSDEEQGSSQQGGSKQRSVGSDNAPADNTSSTTPNQGPNFEENLNQRMSEMFNVFDVFDGDDTELVKKLSDSDRDAIKGNVIRRLKGEFGDNLSGMNVSILDDTFVNYMVDYMITKKKMEPFYIRYIPTNVYKITPRMVESVGLMKVLVEQGLTTNRETLYINYISGGGFEIIGGPGARNEASINFRSQKGDKIIQPRETGVGKRQTQQGQPQQKPEEQLRVSPRADMIQKKAEKEGVESIFNNLPKELQDIVREYENQQFSTKRPLDQTMDNYDQIDLVKKESQFQNKGFESFFMWRLKPSVAENEGAFKRFAEMLSNYTPDKDMCKTVAEFYAKAAELDVPNATDDIQKHASYLTRCRRKNFKYMDFGKTKKLIDSFQSKLSSRPRYQINYSTGKVGT